MLFDLKYIAMEVTRLLESIGPIAFIYLCVLLSCQSQKIESPLADIPESMFDSCIPCHGSALRGNTAQSLLDGSWQFGSRPADIFRSIKFGIPQYGMPSWGGVFQDHEIDTIVQFLLEEEKRLALSKPPLPEILETQDYKVALQVLADGLDEPWGMAFISENEILITEKPGRLRLWQDDLLLPDSVEGMTEVFGMGQGGLLDVEIDPAFTDNGWIYLSLSDFLLQPGMERPLAMTKIIRGKITENQWTDSELLFAAPAETYLATTGHFGGRIAIDREGFLFFSIGDRDSLYHAQDLTKPNGKIHRIHSDGTIPKSNPFYGRPNTFESIYTYGNRNPHGLTFHPETGALWSTEHGPMGGDELNIIEAGKNYGWPVITHGRNPDGTLISNLTRREGMEQPVLFWKPSLAPSGLDFYRGDLFPLWKNRLLTGSLKQEELRLLVVEEDRVIYQEILLKNAGRIRDVISGPDGAIYLLLNRPGRLIKLVPASDT